MANSVIFTESSPNLGGQELQILQQMQALRNHNWQVLLLTRPHSRIAEFALQLGLPIEFAPLRNAADLFSIFKIVRAIKHCKPQALISHSNHDSNLSTLALKFLQPSKQQPIRHIKMRTYLPKIGNARAYNHWYHLAFTPSQYLRSELLKNRKIEPQKVKVLYPGIDFSKLDAPPAPLPDVAAWLNKHPGPVIGHGSMLRAEKGQTTVLRILPTLLQRYPNLRYLIAGEGYNRQTLETQVKDLNLQSHVFFTGLVNPISQLLQYCNLAVMPSLYEPLGMFQIETTALGIPTVASNTGGIPETIKHRVSGLLAPPDQDQAWIQAILEILDYPETASSWAAHGAHILRKQFSIERNLSQLINAMTQ